MNRELYIKEFVSEKQPGGWPCGECFAGTIQIKDNFIFTKDGSYAGHFKCTNPACLKDYTSVGKTTYYSQYFRGEVQKQFVGTKYKRFYPTFFTPTLCLFKLPKELSLKISSAIENSFKLFWTDANSSGNAIRIALEYLMDDLGVSQDGKLHSRIERFQKTNQELGDLLMAIKWIGNAASHGDDLNKNELLDAYEILFQFFAKYYPDEKFEKIKLKAEEININKGIKK